VFKVAFLASSPYIIRHPNPTPLFIMVTTPSRNAELIRTRRIDNNNGANTANMAFMFALLMLVEVVVGRHIPMSPC
jgi:hypothetical protein